MPPGLLPIFKQVLFARDCLILDHHVAKADILQINIPDDSIEECAIDELAICHTCINQRQLFNMAEMKTDGRFFKGYSGQYTVLDI